MMNWLGDGSRQLPVLGKPPSFHLAKAGPRQIASERREGAVGFLLPPPQSDLLPGLSRTFS